MKWREDELVEAFDVVAEAPYAGNAVVMQLTDGPESPAVTASGLYGTIDFRAGAIPCSPGERLTVVILRGATRVDNAHPPGATQ